MIQLPSGRVYLWYWVELPSGNMQVQQAYSDDSGATWTTSARWCLPEAVVYNTAGNGNTDYDEMNRLRAGILDGDVLLMASLRLANDGVGTGNTRDVLRQYASVDGGTTFTEVAESAASSAGTGKHPDVITHDGQLIIAWCAGGLSPYPSVARLSSPWQDFTAGDLIGVDGAETCTNQVPAAGSGKEVSDSDLALVVGDDGSIYMIHRATTDGGGGGHTGEGIIARSVDSGATWGYIGQSGISTLDSSTWWTTADSSTHPRDFSACWLEGRILLAHHWDASPGNEDNSIGVLYLGGSSTITMPGYGTGAPSSSARVSWDRTWIPIEAPGDCGWSQLGSGTVTLGSGALNVSTSSNSRYYTLNPTGTISGGLITRFRLMVNSGGSLTTDDVAVRLRLADSTDDYSVAIRFSTTGARVFDNNAGSAVGSDISIDMTSGAEFLVAMAGSSISVWYRAAPDSGSDRVWTEGPTSTSLTDDTSTPDVSNMIRWGHIASATSDSDWYEVHEVFELGGQYAGEDDSHLALGQDNPDELNPRSYATTPVYVDGGTSVQAVDGPTLVDDLWHIDTRYDYSFDRVFPSVSATPRVGWRSTADGQSELVAFKLSDLYATEHSRPMNDLYGLALFGTNYRECDLEGLEVGVGWVTIGTMQASDQRLESLDWARTGNTIIPDSANNDAVYLHYNEFAGGVFSVQGGGGSEHWKISRNTAGAWTTGTTKRPTLIVGGVSGGATASGLIGQIWAPSMVGIFYLDGADYSAFRLNIPNQNTADGYFQIGTMVMGPIEIFGTENSWGRTVETTAGSEVSVARDRTSRSKVYAPPARVVSLAWTDGVHQVQVEPGSEPDPDYILASTGGNADPVAARADTAYQLEGILRAHDGGHTPLVYLPLIPGNQSGPTNQTITRRAMHMLCRITGPIRIEGIQGEEAVDETVRASVILEEVV
ncbi:MAG: exo-alpha-sialidase [Alphaproteobacteria bacterium]|nr:exo-alpha-sialidase [Alphaproteobacteria bacterium]